MYIHRSLEPKFLKLDAFFKAVLVTGARQVGKDDDVETFIEKPHVCKS